MVGLAAEDVTCQFLQVGAQSTEASLPHLLHEAIEFAVKSSPRPPDITFKADAADPSTGGRSKPHLGANKGNRGRARTCDAVTERNARAAD